MARGGWRGAASRVLCCAFAAGALAISGASLFEEALAKLAGERPPVAEIRLSMKPVAAISPLLYGVNYLWDTVAAKAFSSFNAALQDYTHYTLARYPGGWEAERYDWETDETAGGVPRPQVRGIGPGTLLSAVPQASFVTPSAKAIRDPKEISAVVRHCATLVRRYGNRVKMWEIGNEWWLQRGGKSDPAIREENLRRYAALVKAAAPAMKARNPSIEIYAGGDWTSPEDFARMRQLVGDAAWSAVSGISIHGYCGPAAADRRCSSLAARAAAIRSIAGKSKIYDSEWAVTKRLTPWDYGIRNASLTILAIQSLAFAHLAAAAYWPLAGHVPAIALLSAQRREAFATGVAFGWMARSYRGEALATSGALPAAAAMHDGEVSVIIPTWGGGPRLVGVALAGTPLSRVVSAEVMYSRDPDDPRMSRHVETSPLPVTITQGANGENWAEFTADPGTPGRGRSWEIAEITIR